MNGYVLTLAADDNATFLVTSSDFPELTTFIDRESSGVRHITDALEEAIAARISDGQDLPEPVAAGRDCPSGDFEIFVPLRAQTMLKVALYRALRSRSMTRADLQRALKCHREQVDRLFRIDHASRLDQLEAAFHAMGLDLGMNTSVAKPAADWVHGAN